MCGIAGLISFDNNDPGVDVSAMMDLLVHRGPDGSGIWQHGNIALGHRRLAIIDPSQGQQPLLSADEKLCISFNGEIYNYRELRLELSSIGYYFRTHSDTEVLLYAYQEWGEQCLNKLRGMFAFAICDIPQNKIFIARDQLGIKPLYYLHDKNRFAFASELQAFRCLPAVNRELDLRAIDEYLCLQYIPAPHTIFKSIKKLPPAHCITIDLNGVNKGPQEYWHLKFKPDHGKTESDWLEILDAALKSSVNAHLVADVPFGAFLSGGIDSSAVVGYMSGLMEQPVKTFSIGFTEKSYNELEYAKLVSDKWHTEHHTQIIQPESLEEMLPRLVQHYGEPFGDSSALPTYYVSKLARQHVKMVFSGDGGDESFLGYNSYIRWAQWLDEENRPLWEKMIYPIMHQLRPKRYPKRISGPEGWQKMMGILPYYLRNTLWREEYHSNCNEIADIMQQSFNNATDYEPLQQAQYTDFQTYLPNCILTKVDIASMMNSLEVRTPIVDIKMAELIATMPPEMNMKHDDQGNRIGKSLLKRLMERHYPKEFIYRRKMGFSIPVVKWFKDGDCWAGYIENRLCSPNSSLNNLFNPKQIKRIAHGDRPDAIWVLLMLDEWLHQNV